MPTLINAAVVADTNIPFVWTCSECGMVFALDRITRNPTTSQLQRVNSNFCALRPGTSDVRRGWVDDSQAKRGCQPSRCPDRERSHERLSFQRIRDFPVFRIIEKSWVFKIDRGNLV